MCAEQSSGAAAAASAAATAITGAAAAAAPPACGPQADLLASLGLGGLGISGCGNQMGPRQPPMGTELRVASKGNEKVGV